MRILCIYISFLLTAKQNKLERLPSEGFVWASLIFANKVELYPKVTDLNMGQNLKTFFFIVDMVTFKMPFLYILISFVLTGKQNKLEHQPLEGFNGLTYYLQVKLKVYL